MILEYEFDEEFDEEEEVDISTKYPVLTSSIEMIQFRNVLENVRGLCLYVNQFKE